MVGEFRKPADHNIGRGVGYGIGRAAGSPLVGSAHKALDRTQPGLPMKKGRCATMTHDYKRNGTTTLTAGSCPGGAHGVCR